MGFFRAYLPWGLAWGSEKPSCDEAGASPESLPHGWGGRQGVTSPDQAMVVNCGPGWACKEPTKPITSPPCQDTQVANSKFAGQKWWWKGVCVGGGSWCHLPWHLLGSAQGGAGWAAAPGLHLFWVEEGLRGDRLVPVGGRRNAGGDKVSMPQESMSQQPSQTGKSLFGGGLTHPWAAPIPG